MSLLWIQTSLYSPANHRGRRSRTMQTSGSYLTGLADLSYSVMFILLMLSFLSNKYVHFSFFVWFNGTVLSYMYIMKEKDQPSSFFLPRKGQSDIEWHCLSVRRSVRLLFLARDINSLNLLVYIIFVVQSHLHFGNFFRSVLALLMNVFWNAIAMWKLLCANSIKPEHPRCLFRFYAVCHSSSSKVGNEAFKIWFKI